MKSNQHRHCKYPANQQTAVTADFLSPAQRIATRRYPASAIKSVCILTAALAAGTAQAANFIVDTTRDGAVGSVDGCSLREAIGSINGAADIGGCGHTGAFGTADTVNLSGLHGSIRLDRDEGEISITKPVTINGPAPSASGKPRLTIKGNRGKQPSRIFVIDAGADTSITGLKLTGGQTNHLGASGGAIASLSNLTMADCVVSGNRTLGPASNGGGVAVFGILTMRHCTVSHNSTGDNGRGGGLFVGGVIRLHDSTVSNNSAEDFGGGVYSNNDAVLQNSIVTGNRTTGDGGDGGGIFIGGDADLVNSTVTRNQTLGLSSPGGGLFADGSAELLESTISHNRTKGDFSTGAGLVVGGNAHLIDTTVSKNQSSGDHSGGAGLFVFGNAELDGDTVSGNQTRGEDSNGAGLYVVGSAKLKYSTVSGNLAKADSSFAGGLYGKGNVTLRDTTIAFNHASGGTDGVFTLGGNTFTANNSLIVQKRKDEAACGSPIDSGGNNLVVNPDASITSCGPLAVAMELKDLKLAGLRDNGGDTETHALRKGSVAIDAGISILCLGLDQREEPRPTDGDGDGTATCDIGSYEFQP